MVLNVDIFLSSDSHHPRSMHTLQVVILTKNMNFPFFIFRSLVAKTPTGKLSIFQTSKASRIFDLAPVVET